MKVKLLTLSRTKDWSRLWNTGYDLHAVGCERSTPEGYTTTGEMDSLPVVGSPLKIYAQSGDVRRVRFTSTKIVAYEPRTGRLTTEAADYELTVLHNGPPT